ncbi:MAG: Tetratricopeptide 2 repeat protein [Proteobacteria bacterium]|nr:Tetratricopeptide 2 repeat protein [Pseudomonadota bacterium]
MSLLMDALRKAEEAKRHADQPQFATAASELTLAPMSTHSLPPPELSAQIAPPDGERSATARASPQRGFAERSPFATRVLPKSQRTRWLALALITSALGLGLGAYWWWQLPAASGGLRPVPAQSSAAAPPASALVPPTPPPSPAAAPAVPTSAPTAAPSATADNARLTPRVRPSKPAATAASAAPASALRLARSAPSSAPALERAYDGLQAGRLDEAQRDYQQVLRSDAKNTDALLGLATIAARQGQTELAQSYYLRALESDPNDATAQAGLINTRGPADPMLSESRLKTALDAQPESAALHFALGNLYARQSRWSEAQQAYFHAYAAEPDNADIVFNLAVSLDHLHQNKLAAQYYRMALGSPGVQRGSFDKNQVKQRIAELQP